MPHPKLLRLAEDTVALALALLPEDVAAAAAECVVIYADEADPEDLANLEGEDDTHEEDALLGLFEGFNRMDPLPGDPADMPRITLFLETLWEVTGGDEREFRREVKLTFLHELGHYLGWGEEEIAALGLA